MLQAFEPYLDAIAERLAERLERRRGRMVSQAESELGPRRHRDAAKRRIANNEGGAGRAGRNYLLTPEAVREELQRPAGKGSRGGRKGEPSPEPSPPTSPGGGSAGAKSRARELADFERETMAGLRAVSERRR